jgi:ParB/RepB/Spo0J family partition protein
MSELQVQQIVRKKITWGENDRRYIEKGSLEDLACTIRVHGILEAIGVKPEGDHYIGLWGQRRWLAAEIAGLETVPAVVCAKSMTEAEAREIRLIENVARESLQPLEAATGLAQLMQAGGLSASEVAKRVGLNAAVVSKSLALLSLPGPLRALIDSGAISAASGYVLSQINDPQLQSELAQDVAAGRLSRDALAGKIKASRKGTTGAANARSRMSAKLTGGRMVSVCGSNLSVDSVIAALEELLGRCRSARTKGLGLGTLIKVLADEAKQPR